MTHPRQKFTFSLVSPIRFFLGLTQRFLSPLPVCHIVGDTEEDLVFFRPGCRPQDMNDRTIFPNVTVHKIGQSSDITGGAVGERRFSSVFWMDQVEVGLSD